MSAPIILIGGGTGVGTSRLGLELMKTLDIPLLTSTDTIREVVRATIHHDINPALMLSTYVAGQTVNYGEKSGAVREAEILRAFKSQCSPVWVGIEAVLSRALTENLPIIIEGVHLRPGHLRETDLWDDFSGRVVEYLVHIRGPEVHRARFERRMEEAPDRPTEKYLTHFQEIRWIHDYLVRRAQRFLNVRMIENSGPVAASLAEMRRYL